MQDIEKCQRSKLTYLEQYVELNLQKLVGITQPNLVVYFSLKTDDALSQGCRLLKLKVQAAVVCLARHQVTKISWHKKMLHVVRSWL